MNANRIYRFVTSNNRIAHLQPVASVAGFVAVPVAASVAAFQQNVFQAAVRLAQQQVAEKRRQRETALQAYRWN